MQGTPTIPRKVESRYTNTTQAIRNLTIVAVFDSHGVEAWHLPSTHCSHTPNQTVYTGSSPGLHNICCQRTENIEGMDTYMLKLMYFVPCALNILSFASKESARQAWTHNMTLYCDGWRLCVETNNLRDWEVVPSECLGHVKDYMVGGKYDSDMEMVAKQCTAYVDALKLHGDGKDAWLFDIDETLLSNLPYYARRRYGGDKTDELSFDEWVDETAGTAIVQNLRFYNRLLELGFKIFLLSGRREAQRRVTEENLRNAGYNAWERLILRGDGDGGTTAVVYKSKQRERIERDGYRIRGNSGDQWSDLSGYSVGDRTFKLPNPMYYVA